MSAYQSILDVIADVAEEPEAAAIEVLKALRELPGEVTEAGVDPIQWKTACDAMIAAARRADLTRRDAKAEVRREAWPEMKKRLEKACCRITNRDGESWRVVGTGVSIDINLRTGEVEHSDGALGEQLPEFESIADHIIRSVTDREANKADLARREERRKTHRWDNKKKVWLPRNGIGPVISRGQ